MVYYLMRILGITQAPGGSDDGPEDVRALRVRSTRDVEELQRVRGGCERTNSAIAATACHMRAGGILWRTSSRCAGAHDEREGYVGFQPTKALPAGVRANNESGALIDYKAHGRCDDRRKNNRSACV